MTDFSLTEESARKIKQLINKDRYQPPRRSHNTRPTDNGGSGGGGDQILFRVVDVICGSETSIIAEWTHFTGGCDSEPPGLDPYTGYVQIYDTCILSYYTVDFLLSGADGYGATGRATYWYTREDCVGRWIVDAICGQPECA